MKPLVVILFLFNLAAPVWAQTERTLAFEVMRRSLGTNPLPNDVLITGQRQTPDGVITPFRILIQGNRKVRYEIGTGRDM